MLIHCLHRLNFIRAELHPQGLLIFSIYHFCFFWDIISSTCRDKGELVIPKANGIRGLFLFRLCLILHSLLRGVLLGIVRFIISKVLLNKSEGTSLKSW